MKFIQLILFVVILTLTTLPTFAREPVKVPEQLKPWVDWVLHDQEEQYHCIPEYNNSSQLQCRWPTELKLTLNDKEGSFDQKWLVNHESWITLPGDELHWPENVYVNNKAAIVMNKNSKPQIKLQKGSYKISGTFNWNQLPEFLQIPSDTALVSLSVKNKNIHFPSIDDLGKLWLQAQRHAEEKIENKLNIQSYRLIDDRIPPRIVLFLNLEVAGSAREIMLGAPFTPDTFVPVSLVSSLPARVEQDGRIRMQIRPGQWTLTLTVRHSGPVTQLSFNRPDDGYWPKEEIWSFNAHTNLRIVEIENVPAIDPQQTSLPDDWRSHPAYRLLSGDIMIFNEIKRGDPDPAPDQLTLQRDLWLRFNGNGFTIQDRIKGKKHNNWRLEIDPSVKLGRVAVNGKEQFITKMEESEKAGVELRQGNINLTADSEYSNSISTVPATAWDHDFQKVDTRLHLPPGYRILHASGVDNVPRTWITKWTLLDLFVVLIFSISVAKLFTVRLAVLAFITMVLLYHEPGAPGWIWLFLLAGIALLRYLPEGKFKKYVKVYQAFVAVFLILISIPFAIRELRVGIYPQLEKPYHSMERTIAARKTAPRSPMERKDVLQEKPAYESDMLDKSSLRSRARKKIKGGLKDSYYDYRGRSRVAQYDPGMINQTGPGVPAWTWNTVHMNSGPVQSGQNLSFILIGPKTNFVLAFVRVGLLILLALGLFGISYRKGKGWTYHSLKSLLVIPLVVIYLFLPNISHAGDMPSPEILKELQKRLLEKDDCFPNCADISDMLLDISPDNLKINLNVDSQVDSAVSLPGSLKHWLPQSVMVDGKTSDALYKTHTGLWVFVPSGKHNIVLNGKLPKYNTIQVPLPLKPHHITVRNKGWTVEGIHQDGSIDNQIQFKRITDTVSPSKQILDTGVLPQFALVERTLLIGLDWNIQTRVSRISPAGSAIVLDIPLVPGESVISEGIEVKNGAARINLDANSTQITWESALEKSSEIVLKHSSTTDWTEIWQADVSPIFHMEYEGIPVIHHKQGDRWFPKWHPWPDEEVKIYLSRPAGVEGQTITIDKSHLEVRPGLRVSDSKLTLSIRSSQGGQHTIVLPEQAQLQEVTIGGKMQPIRQEGRDVPLPIIPGTQEIVLKWRVNQGISINFRSPSVDLGIQSANSNIDIHLPYNRWPLFVSGPQLGPAILFWSVVIVILLASFGLTLTGLTPLKFHHWFLLGIGMSQSNTVMSFIVVAWLIALHFRGQDKSGMADRTFNAIQVGLALLTVLAMGSLIGAISQGLLGHPDMNIVGNGSGNGFLRWYSDATDKVMPTAGVMSIPMINYRFAMLAWALWISFSLIRILKWGWKNYTKPVIWRSLPKKHKPGRKGNVFGKGKKTDSSPEESGPNQ